MLLAFAARLASAKPGPFYMDDSPMIELTPVRCWCCERQPDSLRTRRTPARLRAPLAAAPDPAPLAPVQQQVMYFAISFIVVVFMLHILGKVGSCAGGCA